MIAIDTALKLSHGKHTPLRRSNKVDVFMQQQWLRKTKRIVFTVKTKLLLLEEIIKIVKHKKTLFCSSPMQMLTGGLSIS